MLSLQISKNVGHFRNFKKLPKENDRPTGENLPNLVTLVAIPPTPTPPLRAQLTLNCRQIHKEK
jgi:hypothetical protein